MVMILADGERRELTALAATVAGWALDQQSIETLRTSARRCEPLRRVAQQLLRDLAEHSYCVIRNVPVESDAELAALLGLVATISTEGNGGEPFFSIARAVDEDESLADRSRTGASFPFHSDSTYMVRPHEMLGLGCVVNDADGGDSSLIRAADIAAQVEAKAGRDALLALEEPTFPFFLRDPVVGHGVQRTPILTRVGEHWQVRYRSDVLDVLVPRYDILERHLGALAVLRSVLDGPPSDAEITIRLRPGDYLMVDNRRALHARTALGRGARELRRSKGYFLHSEYGTIL